MDAAVGMGVEHFIVGCALISVEDRLTRLPAELKGIICEGLGQRSLVRLSQVNRVWHGVALPVAYARNAAEHNSSAMRWACVATIRGGGEAASLAVLQRSLAAGGDAFAVHRSDDGEQFAMAIHLAAAAGRASLVRLLLDRGADPDSVSSGWRMFEAEGLYSSRTGCELAQYGLSILHELKGGKCQWLPMLLPLLRGDAPVVAALLDGGATARLSHRLDDDDDGRGIVALGRGMTAFHLFAAMSEDCFTAPPMHSEHMRFFDDALQLVTQPMGSSGYSPLHIAAEFPNPRMLRRLLAAEGTCVDTLSDAARTPLMHVVRLYAEASDPARCAQLLELINLLIRGGADINVTSVTGESPLVCALPDDVDQWTRAQHHIRRLLTLLISKGASINGAGQATSIITVLCQKICEWGDSASLQALVRDLIEQGGDVNQPVVRPSESIILHFLRRYKHAPKGFFRTLISTYGATIDQSEADAALYAWLAESKLRSATRGYDVLALHRNEFSAAALDTAWYCAFQTNDRDLYERLVAANFKLSGNANLLVEIAVKTPGHKLWDVVRTLTFNPNYIGSNGRSYLHMVIAKLTVPGSRREAQAVEEAVFFIGRGTSVRLKDAEGLTPLQQLRKLISKGPYKDLRLIIHEAKDRENGEL